MNEFAINTGETGNLATRFGRKSPLSESAIKRLLDKKKSKMGPKMAILLYTACGIVGLVALGVCLAILHSVMK